MPDESPELGEFLRHFTCCSVRKFAESGCKIYLPTDQQGWLCLSGDKYTASHNYEFKLADLLFAWQVHGGDRLSCALELKSGRFRVSGVVTQLQQGAEIIDQLLHGMTVKFLPVLIHGPISTITFRELDKQKVGFRGKPVGIHLLRCGSRVEDLKW